MDLRVREERQSHSAMSTLSARCSQSTLVLKVLSRSFGPEKRHPPSFPRKYQLRW